MPVPALAIQAIEAQIISRILQLQCAGIESMHEEVRKERKRRRGLQLLTCALDEPASEVRRRVLYSSLQGEWRPRIWAPMTMAAMALPVSGEPGEA